MQSPTDAPFTFCMSKLLQYVEHAALDAIAITNHNLFNIIQFEEIRDAVKIEVFPGIEVDVAGTQILVIADPVQVVPFQQRCRHIEQETSGVHGSISLDRFLEIFDNLEELLVIPHYEKKPAIRPDALKALSPHVTAGEVSSIKKFIYCIQDPDRLVPVYFSDSRIRPELRKFPVRQTFVDCGDARFSSIKHALRDKNKVSLSEDEGNRLFQIFDDGQCISTGLNVLLGERSSGKSYTLSQIAKRFENVKHIRQFELVARNDDDDERRFNEALSQSESLFSREYLADLQRVLVDIMDVDLARDERQIEEYLDSLKKSAFDAEKQDSFSKAALYKEELFPVLQNDGLEDLIRSTKNLFRNEEFRTVIDKHIPKTQLQALYVELLHLFSSREEERLKKVWINEVVSEIQNKLQVRTAATTVAAFDPYRTMINLSKVKKFEALVEKARTPRTIQRRPLQGFFIEAAVRPFSGPGELKKESKVVVAFKDAFESYDRPYQFLQQLKQLPTTVQPADFFKFFVKIDYRILNKDGFDASGGERSEFFLLSEIERARQFDMLLIDEPESSFDNVFLRDSVNEIIKDLSRTMPVVIVTHNNTVGASIKPDYVLYTQKSKRDQDVEWSLYSGFPTDLELRTTDGRSVRTIDVALGCLEAGQAAYEERARGYADLKG